MFQNSAPTSTRKIAILSSFLKIAFLLWIYLGFMSLSYSDSKQYTLEQCFQLALERSAALAGQLETIHQAEEHIKQAWAIFLPQLSANGSILQQQDPGTGLAQSVFPANQTTVKATVSQNLFKGFKDFANLKQKRLEKSASEFALEQARLQLFQDTAQAFYTVLAYEFDNKNYLSEIEANRKRKTELLQLKKLARAREADIVSVDSSIANLQASLAASQGLLTSTRETLSFLTGLPPETAIADSEAYPSEIGTLESWLSKAHLSPTVMQAKRNFEAADLGVSVARSFHLPSADLNGNYYFVRPGLISNVTWDVQLNFSLPLFSGGLIQSQVREAASQRQNKEAQLDQAKRQIERDIRFSYQVSKTNIEQVKRLWEATQLSKARHELLSKDNRSGLASNVDVLQALATEYQTKRSYDHVRCITKLEYARLQALASAREISHETP